MFKLKVADAKLLRDMATAISIPVDEATFKIDPRFETASYGSLRRHDRF